jgi:ATP-binding cassette subfamily B protein
MDDGYYAMVGERGSRLSGGQRQRIGIARALYANTDILVLDESTSAIDFETESKILSSIHDIMKEITLIVVAHRFTVIKDCDQIFRVEQGRMISEKDPDKMFSNKIGTIE